MLLRLAHRFHGLKAANLSFVETILAKSSLMASLSSITVIVVTFIIIRFCLVLYGSRRSKTNKHLLSFRQNGIKVNISLKVVKNLPPCCQYLS